MVSAGTHPANAVGATLCETKAGREQVAIEFVTEHGEPITAFRFFGDKVDSGGKTLTERTIADLRACGWVGDDLSDLSSVNGNSRVEIVVEQEEYEGKVRSKVRFINGPDGSFKPKPMEDSKAKRFAEKMKTKVGRIGTGAGSGFATPAQDLAPSVGEDDIPF